MFSAGSEGSIIKLVWYFHVGFSSQLILGILIAYNIWATFSDDNKCVHMYMHLIKIIMENNMRTSQLWHLYDKFNPKVDVCGVTVMFWWWCHIHEKYFQHLLTQIIFVASILLFFPYPFKIKKYNIIFHCPVPKKTTRIMTTLKKNTVYMLKQFQQQMWNEYLSWLVCLLQSNSDFPFSNSALKVKK